MMTYLVTARKWRPMVFEDVVGQSHVATTLRNAIASNRLSHAYIFSGPRGVGKTTMARILAKAINCKSPREFNPDNACDVCKEITEGRGIDVLEIDGASNRGVDEIRNLRESVRYGPARGKYKVYIIDEVHMLTKEAFNALLKTLEEPPSHILFIFATTEVHKVPPTILSRCQRFDFRRISVDEIVQRLRFIADQEGISIPDDALMIIAKKADGSLRDAQSIFDQVVSFSGEQIDARQIMQALNVVDEELYFRVTSLIQARDTKGGLALVEEIINRGYDIKEFLSGLNEHFRDILIVLTTGSTKLVETSDVFKKRYEEEARKFSEQDLFRLIKVTSDLTASLRWTDQPRFKLEVGLLQMIKMDSTVRIEELLRQIEDLKKRVNGGSEPAKASQLELGSDNVKIAGSVKASPPSMTVRSRPADRWVNPDVTEFTGFQPLEQPTYGTNYVGQAVVHVEVTEPVSFSLEESAEKWRALVDMATKQKVVVGTVLKESRFGGFSDNTLRVRCPDDVHLSMLKRNREYLNDLAHQVYGAKVRLEAIVSSTSESQPAKKDHPVIAALKRELGAEPID